MAWTDTCKIEAVNQVEVLLKRDGISRKEAIERLSGESDIPYGTLERWVYPRKPYVKNDVTPKPEPTSPKKSATKKPKELMSKEFNLAWQEMMRQIREEKNAGWKTTSKDAALRSITTMLTYITMGTGKE